MPKRKTSGRKIPIKKMKMGMNKIIIGETKPQGSGKRKRGWDRTPQNSLWGETYSSDCCACSDSCGCGG